MDIDNSIEEEQPRDDPADIKLIIIGDSAVGKSKLIERYLINDYNQHQVCTHPTFFKINSFDFIFHQLVIYLCFKHT